MICFAELRRRELRADGVGWWLVAVLSASSTAGLPLDMLAFARLRTFIVFCSRAIAFATILRAKSREVNTSVSKPSGICCERASSAAGTSVTWTSPQEWDVHLSFSSGKPANTRSKSSLDSL